MNDAGMTGSPRTPSTVWSETSSLFDARRHTRTGTLYAILDACDAPAVPPKVAALGEDRGISLYRGSAEEKHADIAPYLVAVDDGLLDWILETLWDQPWGILVVAQTDFASLRTHFRKFLVVDAPSGEKWYFRYYDPRVLTKHLATCTEEELRAFFGPVQAFGTTDDAGVRWMRFATPQEEWAIRHPTSSPRPKITFSKPQTG